MTSTERDTRAGSQERTGTSSDISSQAPTRSSSDARTKPQDWTTATENQKTDAISDLLAGKEPSAPAERTRASTTDEDGSAPEPPAESDPDSWAPDPENPEDGADGAADEGSAPSTLAELAERLEMAPEKLYEMELTTGDGEAVTLGALKDAWQDRRAEAHEGAKRAKALDERESALAADARLWSEISDEVGRHLSPELKARLRWREQQNEQAERRKLAAAMPELNDPDTLYRFKSQFIETLEGYGFRPHEVHITDHRNVLMVRDLMDTKARLDKLLSYDPKQPPPKAAKQKGRDTGKKGRQRQMIDRARHGTEKDKVSAISILLRG